jgi:hypothetical protein
MTCADLHDKIEKVSAHSNLDDFSRAHLQDVQRRLHKALDANFEQM